jgi:hypothetical protein
VASVAEMMGELHSSASRTIFASRPSCVIRISNSSWVIALSRDAFVP